MSRAEQDREKLFQAIAFFTKSTKACYKLKLFKLLHFLDFEIFRETGKSVTGLDYFAWPMGPVPKHLYEEFEDPLPDMKFAFLLRTASELDPDFTTKKLTIIPKAKFDAGPFTPRELKAMERLAEIYRDTNGKDMSDVSHLKGQPWHRVYKVENKPQARIPYELALDSEPGSISKEQADRIAEEMREVDAMFK